MNNNIISDIFRKIASLLEIKGDNPFKIRAYLKAADNISSMDKDLEGMSTEELQELPGIGKDLAVKIREIYSTGECRYYDELKSIIPEGVLKMTEIPEIGPKTARLFYESLKIDSVDALKNAALSGALLKLPGVKQKTVDNIIKGIELLSKESGRMNLLEADLLSRQIVDFLKKVKGVSDVVAAGSVRRAKESVRDIDILAISKKPDSVMNAFVALPMVKQVLSKGEKKSSILYEGDRQIDLRIFDSRSYGAALVYFTGSKNHNIKLRSLANKIGYKINEYGVFDSNDRRISSFTEKAVYRSLGLDYIVPEMREDSGEIEASLEHRLPALVDLTDIKGDFHAHTNYSDGENSVEDMAIAAKNLGYEYICLTDHSISLKVAGGLDLKALKKKKKEIDSVNKKLKKIKVLFAAEVEIDGDGALDYSDDVLSGFDIVVAAIHSGFKQSRQQLTRRVIRACENRHVDIIAHPTGKQWPKRGPYELDFDEIFNVAASTNTALEINAHPYRLDLSGLNARKAKDANVKIAIGSDSHSVSQLSYMRFGVATAKRGWLRSCDVLNTLSLEDLLKNLK